MQQRIGGRAALAGAAVVAAAALTLPASASGVVHTLKGKVVGDANGTVSMKVVVRNGKPRRVKAFRWKNLDSDCPGNPEVSGFKRGSTRIEFNKFFRAAGSLGPTGSFDFSGFVRRRGRKIANGNVQLFLNGGSCEAPVAETSPRGGGKFTARKV